MIDAPDRIQSPVKTQSSPRPESSPALPPASPNPASAKSLPIERIFSDATVKPFDQIEWENRTAEITDDGGKVIFKQENVEVPKSWSLLATKVVVSKYFYGEQNTAERETSVRQLIHRVCRTIADWGVRGRLFRQGRRRGFLR